MVAGSLLTDSSFLVCLRGLCHRSAHFISLGAGPFTLTDYSPGFHPAARKIIIGPIFVMTGRRQWLNCLGGAVIKVSDGRFRLDDVIVLTVHS